MEYVARVTKEGRRRRLEAHLVTISPMLAAKIAIRRARHAEDPDHNPTLDTLGRVASALDADLLMDLRLRRAS